MKNFNIEVLASRCGLRFKDILLIVEAVKKFPEIHQLILFGSRAKGCAKTGSDVDLAIKGTEITYETAIRFSSELNEELPLPYYFDVVNYSEIQSEELIAHIDRVGVILFSV